MNPEIDIVKNGSFEEGIYAPDNPPNNWNRVIWEASDADLTWEDSQSIEGSKSVKIDASEPNDARWVQTVTVEPFTEYRLSGWIKTESVSHSVDLEDAGANLCLCDEWGRTRGYLGTMNGRRSK